MLSSRRLIIATIIALLCVSCVEKEEEKVTKSPAELYNEAFLDMVTSIGAPSNWNQAARYSIKVNPEGPRPIKVYAKYQDTYRQVARYSKVTRETLVDFDAPYLAYEFLVDIDGKRFLVASGSQVRYSQPSNFDDRCEVSDEPFPWIVAVENDFDATEKEYYSEFDFDFNDAVLRFYSVESDDSVFLTITPLAVGDRQRMYMHLKYNDNDRLLWPGINHENDAPPTNDCELHLWFGVKDYMTRVNTGSFTDKYGYEVVYNDNGGWASVDASVDKIFSCHLHLEKGWSMVTFSDEQIAWGQKSGLVNGFYITVGTFKTEDRIKDDPNYRVLTASYTKDAPHMILIPDESIVGCWHWPNERVAIAYAYSAFPDWFQDPENPSYGQWYYMGGIEYDLLY